MSNTINYMESEFEKEKHSPDFLILDEDSVLTYEFIYKAPTDVMSSFCIVYDDLDLFDKDRTEDIIFQELQSIKEEKPTLLTYKEAIEESRESIKKYKKKWEEYRIKKAKLFESFFVEENSQ